MKGIMPNIGFENNFLEKTASYTSIILKGVGQIMLQENAISGLLFLIGIFYGSFLMGVAALLATVCGTATAILLKYDKSEVDKGLYGFSAALVGVAVLLFLKPVALSWLFIIIGSSLATIIQHFFKKRKIPVFTLPFVLVTWAIILIARVYFADFVAEDSSSIIASAVNYVTLGFKGFGQVIFQGSLVAGLLFFIAVLISSPIAALYGLTGGVLSAIIALKLSVPINDIDMGLFSYNAVLCAIVFAGTHLKDSFWVLFSLFISLLMAKYNVIPLTFPFVLASCITLFVKSTFHTAIKSRPSFARKQIR